MSENRDEDYENLSTDTKRFLQYNDLTFENYLEKGGFGLVYLVSDKNNTKLALKIITNIPELVQVDDPEVHKEVEATRNEVKLMFQCNCENIVKLIGCTPLENIEVNPNQIYLVENPQNSSQKLPFSFKCILSEYCNGGDLYTRIANQSVRNEPFDIKLVLKWSKEILNGLAHLQKIKIIHKDIKLENIFLSDNVAKLGDFGIAQRIRTSMSSSIHQVGFSIWYFSPELYDDVPQSFKSDMWSTGCVIYELIILRRLFGNMSESEIMERSENFDSQKEVEIKEDKILESIVRNMLRIKPNDRQLAATHLETLTKHLNENPNLVYP